MRSGRMSLQACVPLFLILQITLTCSPPFCHWSKALENTPLNLRLRLSSWTSPWSADKTVPTIGKFVTNYHRFFHDVVSSHVFAPLQLHNGGFLESYWAPDHVSLWSSQSQRSLTFLRPVISYGNSRQPFKQQIQDWKKYWLASLPFPTLQPICSFSFDVALCSFLRT